METSGASLASVGNAFGIDATTAAGALGAILAAFMVWLGHWVSHANARTAADLQSDEKAAVLDLRDISVVTVGADRLLRFEVWNVGQTAAREVIVRRVDPATPANGFASAFAAVVAATDRPVLEIDLPNAIAPTDIVLQTQWRDHRGRLRTSGRRLLFDAIGGPPRQSAV